MSEKFQTAQNIQKWKEKAQEKNVLGWKKNKNKQTNGKNHEVLEQHEMVRNHIFPFWPQGGGSSPSSIHDDNDNHDNKDDSMVTQMAAAAAHLA